MALSRKIVFIAVPGVVFILCLELALRFAGFSYYGLSSHLRESFTFDRDLKYRMVPGDHQIGDMKFHVNRWGYRGRDWNEKKDPNVFRIMAIGDSSTFGYLNEDAETYPRILEDIFKRQGKNVEVLNMGVIAYSSWGSVVDYNLRGSKFDPDMLILFLGNWNDFHPTYRHPDITEREYFRDNVAKGAGSKDYAIPWSAVLKLGQIYMKIRDGFIRKSEEKKDKARFRNGYYIEDKPEFVRRAPVSEFEENLKFFIDAGKEGDIPLIFIVPKLKPHRALEKPICDLYREKVRNIPTGDKVKLLDLDDVFEGEIPDEIWQDDGFHFKARGNRMIAEGVASIIEDSGVIP